MAANIVDFNFDFKLKDFIFHFTNQSLSLIIRAVVDWKRADCFSY